MLGNETTLVVGLDDADIGDVETMIENGDE